MTFCIYEMSVSINVFLIMMKETFGLLN